jgi:hypothetical protein
MILGLHAMGSLMVFTCVEGFGSGLLGTRWKFCSHGMGNLQQYIFSYFVAHVAQVAMIGIAKDAVALLEQQVSLDVRKAGEIHHDNSLCLKFHCPPLCIIICHLSFLLFGWNYQMFHSIPPHMPSLVWNEMHHNSVLAKALHCLKSFIPVKSLPSPSAKYSLISSLEKQHFFKYSLKAGSTASAAHSINK